ncbi:MAG: hypothetical protein NTY01_04880, partial [Verrucomicrobia bacterium]|nr:hypothetical protein [Verrucomicrobiota bacterium]
MYSNAVGLNYVGYEGSGNSLTLSNGATVAVNNIAIGATAISRSNAVIVTDAGSRLQVPNLSVGSTSSWSTLRILNGAVVCSDDGDIGHYANAGNNSVLVSGPGSVWTNRNSFTVGYEGVSNQAVIANGAMVATYAFCIGNYGSSNTLSILNGGMASNTLGFIGLMESASNNVARVSGNGSLWKNSSLLYVGYAGSSNRMEILNAGRVFSPDAYVGYATGSVGNSLTLSSAATFFATNLYIGMLTGANSNTVTVTDNETRLEIPDLYVGYSGSWSRLSILNGGTVSNRNSYIGYAAASKNNSVLVSGSGSLWSNYSGISIGENGSLNRLTVSNGGTVTAAACTVGFYGSSNRLEIMDGGRVIASSYFAIGAYPGSVGNSVLISGAGSLLSNALSVYYVGHYGSGNSLTLSNAATLSAGEFWIGAEPGAHSNTVVVTDSGSRLETPHNLYVGNTSSWNSLSILNGGVVSNFNGYIGYGAASSNNSVLV